LWFWGWLVAACAMAAVGLVLRDRASLPFAIGAGVAAALEAVGGDPASEWIAFAVTSCVLFAIVNRQWYRARHLRRGLGRHGASEPRDA
jgi:membrane protein implicated in regulation of membrane protease activity